MRSDRFRFIVLTCREPKGDWRLALADALRREHETICVWMRRRPVITAPDGSQQEVSLPHLLRRLRHLPTDDRINVYFNCTNTYFPGMSAILRAVAAPGIWCFDLHDDFRYHNTGWIRWRETAYIALLRRLAHVTVHAAPTLQALFPDSRHLGNASEITPQPLPPPGTRDVLIIASFDERFDFDFVADLAEASPDSRFDLFGWTRPDDTATQAQVQALAARHANVRYHGPYVMADLPGILRRYRVSVAPYRADDPQTRYIDPLRFYHCLNAGLEVISTDIPQARFMAASIHVVDDAAMGARTLAAIQSGTLAKQPGYTPITWANRAARLVGIVCDLPRTAMLRRRRDRRLGNGA